MNTFLEFFFSLIYAIDRWRSSQAKSWAENSGIKFKKQTQIMKRVQGRVWHSERDLLFTQCFLANNDHIMAQSEKGYFVSNAIEWEGHTGQSSLYCSWKHVSFSCSEHFSPSLSVVGHSHAKSALTCRNNHQVKNFHAFLLVCAFTVMKYVLLYWIILTKL